MRHYDTILIAQEERAEQLGLTLDELRASITDGEGYDFGCYGGRLWFVRPGADPEAVEAAFNELAEASQARKRYDALRPKGPLQ
jgi:hypothetical protein